jgi:hypothetical protein
MKQIVEPAVCDPQSDESLGALINLASSSANWTEQDARYLIDKIDRIIKAGTWHRRLQGEPKTWDRFCNEVLGYEDEYIDKIREGLEILEASGVKHPTVGQAISTAEHAERGERNPVKTAEQMREILQANAEYGKLGGRGNKNPLLPGNKGFRLGNSSEYLARRIARDRPDILERMKAGEFRSVRAAAREAGLVKPTLTIPAEPAGAARIIRKHFTREQIQDLRDFLDDA